MAHAFAAHFLQSHFNATFFADNTAILHPLIFAAKAFIVLDWPKNSRAKQTVSFGLESPIINGLRFFNLAVRP